MRRQAQPGPAAAERLTILPGEAEHFTATLEAGLPLNEAIASAMLSRGQEGGVLVLRDAVFQRLRFVIPALSDDPRYAAFYSATHDAPVPACAWQVNATFGVREGAPFTHLHGCWTGTDGQRRGGHILPLETVLAAPAEAKCWAVRGTRFHARPDAETNFTLFAPERCAGEEGASGGALVKIQPNEDFCTALETACTCLGWPAARVRGGVGSLVGAHFTDTDGFGSAPTEVFVREGQVAPGPDGGPRASVRVFAADHRGEIAEGLLRRADNAVLMTFELLLTREAALD